MTISIRFMTGDSEVSRLIRLQAGIGVPFPPSHTEALTQDGKFYIGAHIDGGILARPVGYDADQLITLPDGSKSERIVSLDCTPAQEAAFYAFVHSKIGEPYDWKAILDFVDPALNLHDFDHLICSAFMASALRNKVAPFLLRRLSVPFHHISPYMLFFGLSMQADVGI